VAGDVCMSLRNASAELNDAVHDLSNFQGKHGCDARVWMGKPTSVAGGLLTDALDRR
jgi:hypothetical protein